ncbi:DUF5821 family protein [Halorubrum ejinorense]|uniref:DUF5821 family protein n=1 Tax=Halorubrum ejinorense TaxID=425309 RepID=A0AAV3SX29_9EURY
MPTGPAFPLLPEPLPLEQFSGPLLVDPGPRLLGAVVEAYREAAPTLVAPTVSDLASGDGEAAPSPDLPTLSVFAGESAIDAATEGFRSAARLAALLDAGVVDLRVIDAPQPNPVLAGVRTGFALVEGKVNDKAGTAGWYRVGDDGSLRERYASRFADAEPYRLRTPSRRRVYEGFATRCDESVAAAVVRTLDAPAAAASGGDDAAHSTGGGDGPGPESTRIRAYAAGAREGVLDRTLRRACEDAGLGSPSTFTRVKRLLREAELIETVSESQPVGRPRDRLAARGALAAAETPAETVAAVRGVGD